MGVYRNTGMVGMYTLLLTLFNAVGFNVLIFFFSGHLFSGRHPLLLIHLMSIPTVNTVPVQDQGFFFFIKKNCLGL